MIQGQGHTTVWGQRSFSAKLQKSFIFLFTEESTDWLRKQINITVG